MREKRENGCCVKYDSAMFEHSFRSMEIDI